MFSKKKFLKIFLFSSLLNNIFPSASTQLNSLNESSPRNKSSQNFSSNNQFNSLLETPKDSSAINSQENFENMSEEEMMKMFENMSEEEIFSMMENMFYNSYQSLSDEEKDMVAKELQIPREELDFQVNAYNNRNNNFKIEEPLNSEEKKPEIKKAEKADDLKKIKEEVSIFEDAENVLSSFLSKTTEKILFNTSVEKFATLISDVEISIYYIKFIIPLLKDFLQKEEKDKKGDFEKIKIILKKTINLKELVLNVQTNNLKEIVSESEKNLLQKYSSRNKNEIEKKINDLIEIKSKIINEIANDKNLEKKTKEKKIAHEKFLLIELENDLEKVKKSNIEKENENITKNISKQKEIVKNNFLEAASEINKLYPELLDLLENFIKANIPDEYKKLKEKTDIIKKAYEEEKNIYLNNAKKSQGSISTENLKSESRYKNEKEYSDYNDEYSDYYQNDNGYYEDYNDYNDSEKADLKLEKENNNSENKEFFSNNSTGSSATPKKNFSNNNYQTNSQRENLDDEENYKENKKSKNLKKESTEEESIKNEINEFEENLYKYFELINKNKENEKTSETEELKEKIENFINNLNSEKLDYKEEKEEKTYFSKVLEQFFEIDETDKIGEIKTKIIEKIKKVYENNPPLPESYSFLEEKESSISNKNIENQKIENKEENNEDLNEEEEEEEINNLVKNFNY